MNVRRYSSGDILLKNKSNARSSTQLSEPVRKSSKSNITPSNIKKPITKANVSKKTDRKPKIPKRKLKVLSVEEEALIKCLNESYSHINENMSHSQLTESEKAVVALKEILNNGEYKMRPVAAKPKDQLVISKPLLGSVLRNSKLKETIKDPNLVSTDILNSQEEMESFENCEINSNVSNFNLINASSQATKILIRSYSDNDLFRKKSSDISPTLKALKHESSVSLTTTQLVPKAYDDIQFTFDVMIECSSDKTDSSDTYSSMEFNLDTGVIKSFVPETEKAEFVSSEEGAIQDFDQNEIKANKEYAEKSSAKNDLSIGQDKVDESYENITNKLNIIKELISEDHYNSPSTTVCISNYNFDNIVLNKNMEYEQIEDIKFNHKQVITPILDSEHPETHMSSELTTILDLKFDLQNAASDLNNSPNETYADSYNPTHRTQKVDIAKQFYTSVANNSFNKSIELEHNTNEKAEWIFDNLSSDEDDNEYNYKNILRENRFGVTSPLNIRPSYRDVVREIKHKFKKRPMSLPHSVKKLEKHLAEIQRSTFSDSVMLDTNVYKKVEESKEHFNVNKIGNSEKIVTAPDINNITTIAVDNCAALNNKDISEVDNRNDKLQISDNDVNTLIPSKGTSVKFDNLLIGLNNIFIKDNSLEYSNIYENPDDRFRIDNKNYEENLPKIPKKEIFDDLFYIDTLTKFQKNKKENEEFTSSITSLGNRTDVSNINIVHTSESNLQLEKEKLVTLQNEPSLQESRNNGFIPSKTTNLGIPNFTIDSNQNTQILLLKEQNKDNVSKTDKQLKYGNDFSNQHHSNIDSYNLEINKYSNIKENPEEMNKSEVPLVLTNNILSQNNSSFNNTRVDGYSKFVSVTSLNTRGESFVNHESISKPDLCEALNKELLFTVEQHIDNLNEKILVSEGDKIIDTIHEKSPNEDITLTSAANLDKYDQNVELTPENDDVSEKETCVTHETDPDESFQYVKVATFENENNSVFDLPENCRLQNKNDTVVVKDRIDLKDQYYESDLLFKVTSATPSTKYNQNADLIISDNESYSDLHFPENERNTIVSDGDDNFNLKQDQNYESDLYKVTSATTSNEFDQNTELITSTNEHYTVFYFPENQTDTILSESIDNVDTKDQNVETYDSNSSFKTTTSDCDKKIGLITYENENYSVLHFPENSNLQDQYALLEKTKNQNFQIYESDSYLKSKFSKIPKCIARYQGFVSSREQKMTSEFTPNIHSEKNVANIPIRKHEYSPGEIKFENNTQRQSYPTIDKRLLTDMRKVKQFAQHFERLSIDKVYVLKNPNQKINPNFQNSKKKPVPFPRIKNQVAEKHDLSDDSFTYLPSENCQDDTTSLQFQESNSKFPVNKVLKSQESLHSLNKIIDDTFVKSREESVNLQNMFTVKSVLEIKSDDPNSIHKTQAYSSVPTLGKTESLNKLSTQLSNNSQESSSLKIPSSLEAVGFRSPYSEIPRLIENNAYEHLQERRPIFTNNSKKEEEERQKIEFVPLDESTQPVFNNHLSSSDNQFAPSTSYLLKEKDVNPKSG